MAKHVPVRTELIVLQLDQAQTLENVIVVNALENVRQAFAVIQLAVYIVLQELSVVRLPEHVILRRSAPALPPRAQQTDCLLLEQCVAQLSIAAILFRNVLE